MATDYTITLSSGMKLTLTLDTAPIHLRIDFKNGKNIDFDYDPSPKPSKIKRHPELGHTSTPTENPKIFHNRISADQEWVEYESTNAQGTEH
jgi:hypothetical protein